MLAQLRNVFAPPLFPDDEDKTRVSRVLNMLLWSFGLMLAMAALAGLLVFVQKLQSIVFLLTFLSIVMLAYLLLRRGHVQAASLVFVWVLWIALTVFIALAGGMTTAVASFYLVGAVFAGLLLGTRAAVVLSVLSSLAGLGMILLESSGVPLPRMFPVPAMSGWVCIVLSLFLITVSMSITLNSIKDALASARQQLSERKMTEQALRESEEQYRRLFELQSDAIFLIENETGQILDANTAASAMYGYSREELLSKKNIDLSAESEETQRVTQTTPVAVEQVVFIPLRFHRKKDGTVFPVEITGRFFTWRGRSVHIAAIRDITARQEAEEALRESEERYRTLVENVPIGVYRNTSGPAGKLLMANPAFFDMFGLDSEQDLEALTVADLYVNPAERKTFSDNLLAQGSVAGIELQLKRKDGSPIWGSVTARVVSEAGTGAVAYFDCTIQDISARKRAEEESRQHTAQLEALRQVGLELAAQLDLDTLLHSIVSRAVELLGGTIGGFYLYRPQRRVLEVVVSIGVDPAVVGATLRPGEGLAGKVWQSGEPLVVEDYRHWEGRAVIFDGQDFQAAVGVPVRWGEEFLGVLDVVADAPAIFSASDAELLSLLATQAATAIQNARLFQAEREQRQLVDALREAAQVMGASLDVNEILRLILDQLKRVLIFDTAAVVIFREGNVPDLILGLGYDDERMTSRESGKLLGDSPILRQMAHDLQPLISADVRQLDGWIWVPGAEHVRSWLGIPLVARERMIGALMVDHSEPGFFGSAELQIAQTLAQHAAQAIENARLYEAEQRRAREAAALSAIAQALNATTDLASVFQVVACHLSCVVDFDRLSVAMPGDGEEQFTMYALSAQESAPLAPGVTLPLAVTAAAVDILAGRPHLTPDLSTELDFAAERTLYEAGLRSRLNLPLLLGETVVGTLNLASYQPHAFSLDQLPLLTQVADAVAAAVQNARLHEETVRRNRELALLNRVIAASATSQEIDTILETACRELARAFDLPYSAAAHLDKKKTQAMIVAEYRLEGRPSFLGQTVPLASVPLVQDLLQHKTALVVEDAGTDPRLGPIGDLIPTDEAIHLLILPLLRKEDLVGSLGLAAVGPRSLTSEEVDLAQRVADQVSSALTRARLEEEQRALEEQFRQSQKMEALGRLAGGIAHDFSNLLTAIQLSTQLMQRRLLPEDPLWAHVWQIQETGARATRLIKQLLSFSRRDIVEPRLLKLEQVVGELSPMLRRIIGEDIELNLSLAGDLWPVKADPSQIEQVIVNLAVNARDAMPEGGTLTIETANVVIDETHAAAHVDAQPGEHVLLAMSDTGMGMDDQVQAHIFEPFFTTKEAEKGTGLGLATVFGIVSQSGGHIHVYSEEGRGTTFRIYLPHAPETGIPEPPHILRRDAEELSPGTETVLVVEDEAALRNQAVQVLEACGYRVLAATDGAEALEISRQHDGPIQLLLTDVVMPQTSGVELAEQLRSERPETRVLYMSGYTPDAIAHHHVLDKDAALLPKPFTMESLAHNVRAVLDGKA